MIKVEGLDQVRVLLLRMSSKASGSWESVLGPLIEKLRRFAFNISPVDTGSYQASHRTTVKPRIAILDIDPRARNTRSNLLVRRYACYVEFKHGYHVYGRTADEALRLGAGTLTDITKELGF